MRKLPAAVAAAVAVLAMAALSGVALAGAHHGDRGSHGRNGHASASVQATITLSSQAGVKPSSTTAHDTDAAAGSDQTKLYGNGKTAGQVAIGNGASSGTDLHGPGNSQPHKICGRDVHAFKGGDCSTQEQASTKSQEQLQAPTTTTAPSPPSKVYICHSTGSATNPFVLIQVSVAAEHAHVQHHHGADVVLGASPGPCPTASQQQQLNAAAAATTTTAPATTTSTVAVTTTVQTTTTTAAAVTTTPSNASGVKGASKTLSGQAASAPSSGVLGAAKTLGRTATTGTLPFTGLRLWIVELIGLGLIGGGVAMRLIARRRIN